MTVKFVVDDLNDSKTLGRTQSIDKIIHNIKRFSPDFYPMISSSISKGNGVTLFTIVGRFVVYLSINPTMTKGDLIFFDTNKDINKALDTVNYLFDNNPKLIDNFMKKHIELERTYDTNYDLAELALNDSIFN